MAGLHLRPGRDTPLRCDAQSPESCPFTKDGAIHFKNHGEFKTYQEEQYQKEFDSVTTITKDKFRDGELKRNNLRINKYYQKYSVDLDEIQRKIDDLKRDGQTEDVAFYQSFIDDTASIADYKKLKENADYVNYSISRLTPTKNELTYTYGSIVEFQTPETTRKEKGMFGREKIVKVPSKTVKARIVSPELQVNYKGENSVDSIDTMTLMDVNSGQKYKVSVDSEEPTDKVKVAIPASWNKEKQYKTSDRLRRQFYKDFKIGDKIDVTSNYDFEQKDMNGTYTITKMDNFHIMVKNDKTGKETAINSHQELDPRGRFVISKTPDWEHDENAKLYSAYPSYSTQENNNSFSQMDYSNPIRDVDESNLPYPTQNRNNPYWLEEELREEKKKEAAKEWEERLERKALRYNNGKRDKIKLPTSFAPKIDEPELPDIDFDNMEEGSPYPTKRKRKI